MGINALRGQRVYLDTNVFIYALEGYPEFVDGLAELFQSIDRGEIHAVTSELTLAEVLVKPFMDASHERQQAYDQVLTSSEMFTVAPVSRVVLKEAAQLRAKMGIKLPDAIHLATACLAGCQTFLTSDKRLPTVNDLVLVLLSEVLKT